MKYIWKPITVAILMALTGCAVPTMTLTGNATQRIPTESVQIYLKDDPSCKYEEVGLLEVPGGVYGMNALLMKFREKAAEFGADGVDISQIDKNGLGEYRGTAVAIRCKK